MAVTRKLKPSTKNEAKQKKTNKAPVKKSAKSELGKASPKNEAKQKKANKAPVKKSAKSESSKAVQQRQTGAPKGSIKKKKSPQKKTVTKTSETKSSPATLQKKAIKDPAKKKKLNKRLSRKSVTESSKSDQKSPKKRTFKSKKSPSKPDGKPKLKKRRKSAVKKSIELNRGVVYFSNLPHGFYEKELKTYCSQFGVVTGVHIPRNEKENAKGYGFVQFKFPEVAEVVADTMNNYLMFTRLIKAKVVPLEEQKPWIFLKPRNSAGLAREKKNKALRARVRDLTPEEEEAYKKKAEARVVRLKNKLAKQGVNYEFTIPASV